MEQQLSKLRNGGWKSMPEFAGFVAAMKGVESMGQLNLKGKEYFERLPDLFLERFTASEKFLRAFLRGRLREL
jgi:hypothetical protein